MRFFVLVARLTAGGLCPMYELPVVHSICSANINKQTNNLLFGSKGEAAPAFPYFPATASMH